ncbi:hypothetical protein [Dietzia aerolata]|uniref:Lipoprotein n=2 Tax=Dietzia aerolata TaxID=595984 RepID=A0ABV5JTL7_9ACTN
MKKTLTALAATALLVLGGCSAGSDEPDAPELAAPTTSETVEVTEHEIKVGETFTMTSPHYVANVTVTDVFLPASCGEVPYSDGAVYPTRIGIAMDIEVESGNGEGFIPNGVDERTKDGYLKDNRGLAAVTCGDYEELSATNVRTGDKYQGVQWLQDDVAPDSEIIIEPHVSAQEPDVTDIYVLDLSQFDLTGEPEPAPEPTTEAPAAPAATQAPAAAAAPTFSYCYLADGTAMMSDGTTTYMDTCNESAGGPPRLADGRSIYELDTPPVRAPEVEAEKQAGHDWWAECIAVNTPEYCRANDPWQN